MIRWHHAETPFGNIVYTLTSAEIDGAELGTYRAAEWQISGHGAGRLSAAEALTEAPIHGAGSIAPDWDALKAEAQRQAVEAGTPFPDYYTPMPEIVVNGKGYASRVTVDYYGAEQPDYHAHVAGRAFASIDGITDSARTKLSAWFAENREVLISAEIAAQHKRDRLATNLQRAAEALEAAQDALTLAQADYREAARRAAEGATS